MLALVLALLAVPAASTWTVDDDGSADFTQITDAIAEAHAGDTLLVEPGTYSGFLLNKRLAILGRPGVARPHVSDGSAVSAQSFTLAGLDFDGLVLFGASGRARIDDCRVGYAGDAGQLFALAIESCAEVVVSRTLVKGSEEYSDSHTSPGGEAMLIRTSNATLVTCDLRGASGHDAGFDPVSGGPGGTALSVSDGSRAVVAATRIEGGYEGFGFIFNCHDGPSGNGLEVFQSLAVLRGAPGAGGFLQAGPVDGICTDEVGLAIKLVEGTVVMSGVTSNLGGVENSGGLFIQPAPEPLVVIDGADAPGAHKTIQIYGPAGASCLLAASFAPEYAPLGQFDDNLWVGLSGFFVLVPLTTLGQAQPITLAFQLPASLAGLEGLSIEMQPFFPGLASAYVPAESVAGNVAEIILRF